MDDDVPAAASAAQPVQPARADQRRDPIASLAGQLRHASTGTLARLRRFHPQQDPQAAMFETERLLLVAGVHPGSDEERARWALVLHCLALAQGRHDNRFDAEPGAVLARLRFSEARLRQLVEADAGVLSSLLPRLARRMGTAGATVNWWPLADLLLPHASGRVDVARQRLVRHYLEAQGRARSNAQAEAAADAA